MKNKLGDTLEQSLKNGTYDRLDFMLGGYGNGMSGLLGTRKFNDCRYCKHRKGQGNGIKCSKNGGKHTWTY